MAMPNGRALICVTHLKPENAPKGTPSAGTLVWIDVADSGAITLTADLRVTHPHVLSFAGPTALVCDSLHNDGSYDMAIGPHFRKPEAAERPDRLPADFDIVIHEAVTGMSEVDTLEKQTAAFNVSGRFVGDLMYRNDRAVFALISTRSVYRHGGDEACKEDETPVEGNSTYTAGKIAMTQLARWLGPTLGRPWVEVRYALPFAPYHPHPKVDLFLEGKMYADAPDSIQQRTYITDLIHQTLGALDHAQPEGEVFNGVLPEVLTLAAVARLGAKVAGVEPDPAAQETGEGPKGHWISPQKTIRALGSSGVSLEEGLRRYLRARREHIGTPQDWMFEGV